MIPHVINTRTSSRSRSRSSSYDVHSRSRYGQGAGNHLRGRIERPCYMKPSSPFKKKCVLLRNLNTYLSHEITLFKWGFLDSFFSVGPLYSCVKSDNWCQIVMVGIYWLISARFHQTNSVLILWYFSMQRRINIFLFNTVSPVWDNF